MNSNNGLITKNDPISAISEAYRILRTNLYYSSVDKKIKTILITSPNVGEGKTTTAANLAIILAQANNKTVLVGADLRKPKESSLFTLKNKIGLTKVISEKIPCSDAIIQYDEVENLYILQAGVIPPNPSDIVQSKAMSQIIEQLKEDYDYIVIDSPPINLVSDAITLAGIVDGVILVIAENETRKDAAKKAVKLLKNIGAKILGIVITKAKDKKQKGYYVK